MSSSFLAIVLLENPATPDMSVIAKALRTRHPGLPVEMSGDPRSSPLIQCGGELVAVMSMSAPMPDDPGLWARTASTWPEGRTIAARSRGHLIVSVLGKDRQPLATARLNTAVIGALISAIPGCCGVVWAGKVARPAKLWLDMSRQSFAPFPDYPFTLWVSVLPHWSSWIASCGATSTLVRIICGVMSNS